MSRNGPVVLTNNYPLRQAMRLATAAEIPGQHTWGAWEQKDSAPWRLAPSGPNWYRKIIKPLMPLVGDPLQQLYALWTATRLGLTVVAADQQSAAFLCVLRRLRLLRISVIVTVHNGPRHAFTAWWMRGASQLLCLSNGVRLRLINEWQQPASSITVMPWGPSLSSPIYTSTSSSVRISYDFVSAGRTNRDYHMLRDLVATQQLTGVVHDGARRTLYISGVVASEEEGASTYRQVVQDIREARMVVIPLADPERISGLTEAADAIALNKPLWISPTKMFPFDPARTGGGWLTSDIDLARMTTELMPDGNKEISSTQNMNEFVHTLLKVVQKNERM